jgi:hypothetical protein
MSGEAGGLLLLPLAAAALPFVLGGLAIYGVARVAVSAGKTAAVYEAEQRRRREMIRQSSVANSIGDFRRSIQKNMSEQTRLNIEASNKMMVDFEVQRNAMQKIAEQNDPKVYQEYISNLKASHTQTMQSITTVQNNFNTSYRRNIAESMGFVSDKINGQYSTYMNELQQLQVDIVSRSKKAQNISNLYIEEAKTLLASLAEDFEGNKFSSRQLITLNEQLNQAISQYNNGRYESAIASAKDVAVNTLEEIYEADVQKQEWDNFYKLALVLSEEVKVYIESQESITDEIKNYAEKASGKQLEDEIIGTKISDYTDKNQKGQTRYDYLLHKANEIHRLLRNNDAQQLTTEQLKGYVDFLNNDLYPNIVACINKGIINMNNAFSRQNISEELIDFFEEHNFMFNGYAYNHDRHDEALHIGLENEATGEELIITLAPELLSSGDIQTHIDIKQIRGEEANEERKAYYRQCVEEVVKGNNPYAQVDIKCKSETRNKLSTDTETKKKLKK